MPPGPAVKLGGLNTIYPYYKDYLGYLEKLYRAYGGIAYFRAGRENIYLVTDLELVDEVLIKKPHLFIKGTGYERAKLILGEGLLTSDNETHDINRLIVQPAFHKKQIEKMIEVIVRNVNEALLKWKTGAGIAEMHGEATELYLKIICEAVFSDDMDRGLIEHGKTFSSVFNNYGLFMLAFPGVTSRLPLPAVKRFKETKEKFDKAVYGIILKRKKDAVKRNDVLGMLMESRYDDGSEMSEIQLRDEIVTLFFAAHDTSAKSLTWTLYLLSQNPGYISVIRKEAEALNEGCLTYEDLRSLKTCRAVISESLRLYPPAHSISRFAAQDAQIGGYNIAKGSSVLIMPYVIHRDSRHYESPEKFMPGRWEPEERKKRHKLSFIPFGAGPRGCLGESFAWSQLIISLALISRSFNLKLHPAQKVIPSSSITLKPKHGMKMILEPAL
jgi:cytochrome P450